ncbi:MAG: hypothetical protein DCC68_25115 [Planctomycetota bacterium]|nr:MAG: hypothetical protein DCC68_25115 [Planctomycetota bacterium]
MRAKLGALLVACIVGHHVFTLASGGIAAWQAHEDDKLPYKRVALAWVGAQKVESATHDSGRSSLHLLVENIVDGKSPISQAVNGKDVIKVGDLSFKRLEVDKKFTAPSMSFVSDDGEFRVDLVTFVLESDGAKRISVDVEPYIQEPKK